MGFTSLKWSKEKIVQVSGEGLEEIMKKLSNGSDSYNELCGWKNDNLKTSPHTDVLWIGEDLLLSDPVTNT